MRVRSWPGLALARPLWPGSAEGQGQGQTDCGPALEGQGQVRKNWAGPGPDRTSDSLLGPEPEPAPRGSVQAGGEHKPELNVQVWNVRFGFEQCSLSKKFQFWPNLITRIVREKAYDFG